MTKAERLANPWPAKLVKVQGDLTNREMAAKLGISRRAYIAWKYKERYPPKIAQTLINLLLQKSLILDHNT